MPPFGAQSIEAGVRHCCLQKIQVIAHERIVASVTEHRRRCEVIEIGWHREWPPPIVYQSCINRHAPAVERTGTTVDRKSTRLNSSHRCISYAVFCLKKKTNTKRE